MPFHHCRVCGGALMPTAARPDRYECPYCHRTVEIAVAEKHSETMRSLLDETRAEQVNRLRKKLYDAVSAEHISRTEVRAACDELRTYLPDDAAANFYKTAVSGNVRRLSRAIGELDVEAFGVTDNENETDPVGLAITFLVKSMKADGDYLLALNNLVERAYKQRNFHLYNRYATLVSEQARRVKRGVYETRLPRDVFVAYSSSDMDKVEELVYELERAGLKCFVAMRNLSHGEGAVENYEQALHEAMDSCRTVVFVSSLHSRNFSCDALRVELPYMKAQDLLGAPPQYRHNYRALPTVYKKPRVEYMIEPSTEENYADDLVGEFFSGYEWAYSVKEVVTRVMRILTEVPLPEPVPAVIPEVKREGERESETLTSPVSAPIPEITSVPEPAPEAEPKPKSAPKKTASKPKATPKPKAEAEPEPKASPVTELKAEAEAKAETETLSAPAPVPTSEAEPKPKSAPKKAASKPKATSKAKPETATTSAPAAQPEKQEPPRLISGTVLTFGHYEQDMEKKLFRQVPVRRPIEWVVLTCEGNRALLLSKYILECLPYHTEKKSVTWEASSLRAWMNETFFASAFTEAEKAVILPTEHGFGSRFSDRVFCLSEAEARAYGTYCGGSGEKPTEYVKAKGQLRSMLDSGEAAWWLRSLAFGGSRAHQYNPARSVSPGVDSFGSPVDRTDIGVRPAIRIDLDAYATAPLPTDTNVPALAPRATYKVGETFTLGSYEQSPLRGREPIEWQVLAKRGTSMLVISRFALEAQEFTRARHGTHVSWETSALRKWLNGAFVRTAFTPEEHRFIVPTENANPKDPSSGKGHGEATRDEVFCLSIDEVQIYLPFDRNRIAFGTDSLRARSYNRQSDNQTEWWLRSAAPNQSGRTCVSKSGRICQNGVSFSSRYGVRPAMWVNSSGEAEKPTDTSSYPSSAYTVGDTLTFGSYAAAGGEKKPIEWQILAKENGCALVISRYVLDARPYHSNSFFFSPTWENCTLRAWLNSEFLAAAFTSEEQKRIRSTTLKTSPASLEIPGITSTTDDRLFCLSIPEVKKYSPAAAHVPPALKGKGTVRVNPHYGYAVWWLRVQGSSVSVFSGDVNTNGLPANTADVGVRPAMWIKLDS